MNIFCDIFSTHLSILRSSKVGFANRLLTSNDDACAARRSSNRVVADTTLAAVGKNIFVGRMFELSSNLGGEILFVGWNSRFLILVPEVAAVEVRAILTADVLPDVLADVLQKTVSVNFLFYFLWQQQST